MAGTYGLPPCGVIGLGRLSRLRCVSGFKCQLRSMNFTIDARSVFVSMPSGCAFSAEHFEMTVSSIRKVCATQRSDGASPRVP
jgi:hypothetical protein